ncbi:MAG: hypothetical protein NTV34_11440 [Proteobacteria bacterium]|nr:hypothetical protein [Pseudomonadota bacterium]
MKKIDIDQVISLVRKGDGDALKVLRNLDVSLLSDDDFKKLLPWFSLSEADITAICQLIEEELQGVDTRN